MGVLEALVAVLDRPLVCDDLFDGVPDTIFFVKDRGGRYVAANRILAERTGFGRKEALIGLTADAVFPGALGRRIAAQDRAILDTARSLKGELELHLYPGGRQGWCLTWKEPLFDRDRAVCGLVGLSRDLRPANATPSETAALSSALRFAQSPAGVTLKVGELAARAQLSGFQLDGRLRAMFGLSAGQYLTRLRIDQASEHLRQGDAPISVVALDCGYADQTAFTRQFRKVVGLSPGAYRRAWQTPRAGARPASFSGDGRERSPGPAVDPGSAGADRRGETAMTEAKDEAEDDKDAKVTSPAAEQDNRVAKQKAEAEAEGGGAGKPEAGLNQDG